MPLLSAPVALVSALPSVLPKLVSTRPVSPSYSLPDPTPSLPKVVSTLLSETCTRMTGGGICTILSRAPTGSVTKMPSTT